MARIAKWCVLGACTMLAACLNSSNSSSGPIIISPVAEDLDSIPPLGASTGVPVPLMSADRNGISSIDGEIIFNADGSFTLNLPNGSSVTAAAAAPSDPAAPDDVLDTTSWAYAIDPGTPAGTEVRVHLGEDTSGRDLFLLARVDSIAGATPSPLTWVLMGDETDTLPTGTATFNGGFYADVLDTATGGFLEERTGDAVIDADFDAVANQIDVALTVTGAEGTGEVYSGTGSFVSGARYEGTIASSGGLSSFDGDFNGAIFGDNAEATAGTFNAVDVGAGSELVGAFTGFQ